MIQNLAVSECEFSVVNGFDSHSCYWSPLPIELIVAFNSLAALVKMNNLKQCWF